MSRMLTVFGLVEDGTFYGDRWQQLTFDKSLVNGHFYSDKAPLSSYLVLPFYWLYRQGHADLPHSKTDTEAANHLAILIAAALPFAIFATLLWWRIARDRPGPSAVWYALVAAFGTSILNYGNAFFGHVLAGTFLLLSWVLSIDRNRYYLSAGLLAGCAVATEYPTFIAVVFILLGIFRQPDRNHRIGAFLVGAIPPAILFFVHNHFITGHFYKLPYSYVVDFWKPMQTGFGLSLPHLNAFFGLSLSPYRGGLFYGPILILLLILLIIDRKWLVLGLIAAYYVFVTSYYSWEGGWCSGPRHLTPVLMIALYEGVGAFARRNRFHALFLALGMIGVAINISTAATNALPSSHMFAPLFQAVLPDLFANRINPHNLLTELFGLKPIAYSLIIWAWLFAVVGSSFSLLAREARA